MGIDSAQPGVQGRGVEYLSEVVGEVVGEVALVMVVGWEVLVVVADPEVAHIYIYR